MADEQRHRALARTCLARKVRDLGGQIDKGLALRLHREQRADDAVDAHRRRPAARYLLALNHCAQSFPDASFCKRLAMSISCRQARSMNDIMRSISWSLGSGISILRWPSVALGALSDFGKASSILPGAGAGSREANCSFSFAFSACSRPISASSAARSSGTA